MQNGSGHGGYLHNVELEEAAAMFVHGGGGPFKNGFVLHNSDEDVNYCNEDIAFSSFLNSLINDDAFASSHTQQPPQQSSEHEAIPNPVSAFGVGWGSAITSSPTFSNETKTTNDNQKDQQL